MKRTVMFLFMVSLLSVLSFPVTIEFWHAMSGDRIALIEDIVSDFEEAYPDIKVNAQYSGSYPETLNKLIAGVQSGNAPHIVQIYEIGTRLMIDSGVIVPVQDLLDQDDSYDVGVLLEPILNYYKVDGKLYSMPFNSSTALLYYNKTLFEEAGLDPNRPPQTYEELLEYSRILTKKDSRGNTVQYGLTWPTHSWIIEQLMAAADAPLVNNDNGRTARATEAVFNSEAGLKIFELFDQLNKEGLILNTAREDWNAAGQNFVSGRAAMNFFSTSDVKVFQEGLESNGYELGTAFLPVPDISVSGGPVIGGASLWLIDGHTDEETKAAWEFLKFVNREDQQIRWHQGTGYFPVRKDAIQRLHYEEFYAENPNYFTSLLQLLLAKRDFNSAGAVIGVFPETRETIEIAYERMVDGQMTPEEALSWAESRVTELIQEYNEFYQ
ncbi:extracellular solute-binding protein family 1 [Petrotoga mobilis SJ95]|uniref:Extracellular solute-binding protein family 1 n=1 Tax=Petrotoga mobilis (strain DSM 10674 / SJ95) TaxID=403833 RepID=A9BFU9_PETMO|nr:MULTISPECIES: ABC transporter substrate-binding protein [Petrotoga]MBL5981739.1 glycerol-3-phosphate ABC transporter substrate-binding protein [Petrotoga sp. 8T1HF07.NaAc.6.1]ABX31445.1 extracellular solute-binding protein family 1 [Petrotoga mobilis SJ95]PNR89690.1 glycerol-3-phosphate ABC transporter substrate-binding protein [Petrotoga sp. 9T1HF07.CasAA.8.2]RLL85099.1 glycerol-3-phosphate ABC transporter substrate-binding protein [Petrotoga sp. Shatin.DS.tank11.9.2.9.3]RLL89843.1 glycero